MGEPTASTARKTKKEKTQGPSRGELFERRVREWRDLDARDPREVKRRVVGLVRLADSLAPLALLLGLGFCGLAVWLVLESMTGMGVPRAPGQVGASSLVKLAVVSAVLGLAILWQLASAWHIAHRVADGIRITPRSAPPLFKRVSDIAQKVSVRTPDRVLLVEELTATTVAAPSMLPFRRPKSVLILGLPLLELLSASQFDAVVAQELARQQPGEFRTLGRVSALSTFAATLAEKSDKRAAWIQRILAWFVDRLNAATLSVSWRLTYACDAVASNVYGPHVVCSALYRIAGYRDLLSQWQRTILRDALEGRSVPYRQAVAERREWFQAPPTDEARRKLQINLRAPVDDLSPLPGLRDRCEKLLKTSIEPESIVLPNGTPSALTVIFGQAAETSRPILEVIARSSVDLMQVAAALQPHRGRLKELDAELAAREPSPDRDPLLEGLIDEWLQMSMIVASEDLSRERARRATELRPTYGDAWSVYSVLLLDDDREEGIAAAANASRYGTLHSTQVAVALAAYYARQGKIGESQVATRLARRSAETDQAIRHSLDDPPPAGEIVAHDLPPTVVALLAGASRSVKGVGRVWIVGRAVPGLRGALSYVLVLEPKFMSFRFDADGTKVATELLSRCRATVVLPAALLVFPWAKLSWAARKRIKKVGQAV